MTTTNDAPAPAPSGSGSGVRVKSLEWSEPSPAANYPEWRARDSNNKFEAVIDTSRAGCFGKFPLTINGIDAGEKFDTLPQAKARAQAVYEARILSALASDASPRGDVRAWEFEWKPIKINNAWQRAVDLTDPRPTGMREYRNVQPLYAHPAPATVESDVETAAHHRASEFAMFYGVKDEAHEDFIDQLSEVLVLFAKEAIAALAPATEGRKG